MITDEMLKQAAEKAANMMNNELSEQVANQEYPFSLRFERKMKRLIRRTNRPTTYRFLRSVACILLIAIIGMGSILAINVEARAAVIKWIKEQFETYQGYIFKGKSVDNAELNRYYPGWIPEGYEQVFLNEDENGGTYVYTDEQGMMAQFDYTYGKQSSALFLESDGYEKYIITVNDIPAELYIATDDTKSSGIVWSNSQDILFYISAFADEDELLEIAENIKNK